MQSKAFLPYAETSWSSADVQRLRALAAEKVPIAAISAILRRSPSAIRNKAGMHGISLKVAAPDRE